MSTVLTESRWRHWIVLTVLLAFAFVVRMGSFSAVYEAHPQSILSPDTPRYEEPAISLLEDGDMQDGLPLADTQDIHVAPAYPVAIALVYALTSNDRASLVYFQVVVSLLSILVVYAIAKEVFNRNVGIAAAMLFSLDPLQFLFSQILLSETLFVFFNLIAVWMGVLLISRYLTKRRFLYACLVGISLGVASLVRPVAYYLVFCVVFGLIVYHLMLRQSTVGILKVVIIVLVSFGCVVGPWHLRNGQLSGSYVFTDNPSKILLYWKAGGMLAYRDGVSPYVVRDSLKRSMPEEYSSLGQKMDLEHERGVEIILGDLPAYIKFSIDGVMRILIGPGLAKFSRFFSGNESGHLADQSDVLECSLVCHVENKLGFRLWYLGIISYSLAFLGAMYLLMLVGLFYKSRIRTQPILIVYLVCVISYFVLASSGHSAADSRMRLPVMPIISIIAASGLLSLRRTTSSVEAAPTARMKREFYD